MAVEQQITPSFPEAMTWPQKAKSITIADQASYDLAAGMKLDLTALRKKIVEEFAPMKEAAHKAHKAITEKEKEHLTPVAEAEAILVSGIKRFHDEQERKRREEESRLAAEARIREEEDRKRREAEAKAIRDEELRIAAEAKKRDEELRIQTAMDAQSSGATMEEVEKILDQPVIEVPEVAPIEAYMEPAAYVPPPVAAPTFDKMKGLGIRETWSAQVFSIKDLCRAVADGVVPEAYVTPNSTALNGRARSDKQFLKIPGVRAVKN